MLSQQVGRSELCLAFNFVTAMQSWNTWQFINIFGWQWEKVQQKFAFYYFLILACWFALADIHCMCSIYLRSFIWCTTGKNIYYLEILKLNYDHKKGKKKELWLKSSWPWPFIYIFSQKTVAHAGSILCTRNQT